VNEHEDYNCRGYVNEHEDYDSGGEKEEKKNLLK
jgi:hypothetical protein